MALQDYKCYSCKRLPEASKAYRCDSISNAHIYCYNCADEADDICRCQSQLLLIRNPLEKDLQNVLKKCEYYANGCTWSFLAKDLNEHLKECLFAPYNCVGHDMKIWECSWKGIKDKLFNHLKEMHASSISFFEYSEEKKLEFDENKDSAATINVVNAFNKHFIFYYEYSKQTQTVNIIIYLLGTKKAAKKYFYEFEILSFTDNKSRIKFSQACYSDVEDIRNLLDSGKCISLSYRVIKNYIFENSIPFRFRMNKREETAGLKSSSEFNINYPIINLNMKNLNKQNNNHNLTAYHNSQSRNNQRRDQSNNRTRSSCGRRVRSDLLLP